MAMRTMWRCCRRLRRGEAAKLLPIRLLPIRLLPMQRHPLCRMAIHQMPVVMTNATSTFAMPMALRCFSPTGTLQPFRRAQVQPRASCGVARSCSARRQRVCERSTRFLRRFKRRLIKAMRQVP